MQWIYIPPKKYTEKNFSQGQWLQAVVLYNKPSSERIWINSWEKDHRQRVIHRKMWQRRHNLEGQSNLEHRNRGPEQHIKVLPVISVLYLEVKQVHVQYAAKTKHIPMTSTSCTWKWSLTIKQHLRLYVTNQWVYIDEIFVGACMQCVPEDENARKKQAAECEQFPRGPQRHLQLAPQIREKANQPHTAQRTQSFDHWHRFPSNWEQQTTTCHCAVVWTHKTQV